jgi:peptide subunit release factor 1 (eRF1)
MINRNDIRELANFHSPDGCAVTFYYQPTTPLNKSHREEGILLKDLVRNALREAEKKGKNGSAGPDLERITSMIEGLHGNGGKAKAIFACAKQGFWREFDVPSHLPETNLILNQRFHLKPLVALLDRVQHACVVLADRTKARIFQINGDDVVEKQDFFNSLTRRGRSDGFGGFDAGHAERHQMNEAMQHFKAVADNIERYFEPGTCERLLIGCHDDIWPEIESQLRSHARQRLVGHFRIDAKTATPDQVKQMAHQKLAEYEAGVKQGLIRDVIGEAHRNSRGAIGLRRVLRSLETGEVQTLLLASNFQAPGVKCYNCGHMDLHDAPACAVCGKENTRLEDIGDGIVGRAIRDGIEIVYIAEDEEFDKIGRIAALLRFRADQNTAVKAAS